jgi:crotonobetainyl-CoA:carnitine CoA-transferase CaiB-like acyl-CoA transferase
MCPWEENKGTLCSAPIASWLSLPSAGCSAASGPLVLTGDDDRPPVRVSVPQAYLYASAEAAVAALIAHHERQHSAGALWSLNAYER